MGGVSPADVGFPEHLYQRWRIAVSGTWKAIISSIDSLFRSMRRSPTATKQNFKTLEDWLAVFMDLDGYIVNGG